MGPGQQGPDLMRSYPSLLGAELVLHLMQASLCLPQLVRGRRRNLRRGPLRAIVQNWNRF